MRRAIEPNGFAAQFPHAAGLCNRELLDAVEEAAAKPGRRTLPSAPAPVPPPAPPVTETATAKSPKATAPATSTSPRPASPTKAGWKGVVMNLKSKGLVKTNASFTFEGNCESVWCEHLVHVHVVN